MSLSKSDLEQRIVSELETQGATASGEHSWVSDLAEALASAIIDEIWANAVVPVSSGSSAGTYPVE